MLQALHVFGSYGYIAFVQGVLALVNLGHYIQFISIVRMVSYRTQEMARSSLTGNIDIQVVQKLCLLKLTYLLSFLTI